MTPLTVYTYVPRNWNASFYYRIFVPFHTARDLGLPFQLHVDTDSAGVTMDDRVHRFCESDIIFLYHPIGDGVLHNTRTAKAFLPSLRDGDWKYPPTVVIDGDDNLFNVTPYNQAFRTLGYKDGTGKEMPKGYMIGAVEDGVRRLMWKDGDDGFDISRNRQTINAYRGMLEAADLVSCSTRHIKDCLTAEARILRAEVFPNLVRFDHYERPRLVQDESKVLILWQGGASHWEDWWPLRNEIAHVIKKYPQVHFLIWGQLYNWITNAIPPDRFTFISWCPYQEYRLRLAMMNHDINLAPLSPTRFNACRSAI